MPVFLERKYISACPWAHRLLSQHIHNEIG